MGQKRNYSKEFKLTVIQELETKSLAEVCREHNLAPSTAFGWKTSYQQNPKNAFQGNGNLYKEDAKIVRYERLIGQLYAEIEFLKKTYEKLKQQAAEDRRRQQLK